MAKVEVSELLGPVQKLASNGATVISGKDFLVMRANDAGTQPH